MNRAALACMTFPTLATGFDNSVLHFCLLIQQDVKFPMSLDVFDLCTEELQQKLMPVRAKFKEIEDKKVEEAEVRHKT